MSNKTNQPYRGFTIVELLIVIVVIGILAAITIVSHNGIQDKANNAKTETAVSDYRKILIAFATVNKDYPLASTVSACLGEADIYPGGCANGGVQPAFNAAVKSFLGGSSLPGPYAGCLFMYTQCRRGAAFSTSDINLDGAPYTWSISYLLKGNVRCTIDGQAGGTWTNALSTPNSNGFLEQDSGTTLCRVLLPNPAKL